MRGGLKIYRGAAAAARQYVEADRSRADDYYLAEGSGIAERFVVSSAAGVHQQESLTGDAYESWVDGFEPGTGAAKGRLRHDDNAVRFVEIVVNGPKSWSLAAELHPDISAAYDAAQDNAARQIVGWLAQHATTRVGPRGAQVQVPVDELDAVTVRHRSSRAGDPHRHLHLQINARVFARDRWRGLHTVGVRDSLEAINGIGHAAVMTDPGFRAALAAHGFTLDLESGEVAQLAAFVGPFSARAVQIARNMDRYEASWRAVNPGREPGPALRRSWDARAWADSRPDKIVPRNGAELTQRWVAELNDLGYREPAATDVPWRPAAVGSVDRDAAVSEILTRLGARRSAWNASDLRGEIEQLVARHNIVTDAAVRSELAEDLTVRAITACVPLVEGVAVPEHVRALTSRAVVDTEADIVARLVDRVSADSTSARSVALNDAPELDAAQLEAAAALSGELGLVVVEGAAGSGKTTTLAAARSVLEQSGRRLIVVAPTLKAARVAGVQLKSSASSAAWLVHQHGYRWTDEGLWTRLAPGEIDQVTGATFTGPSLDAALHRGDLLLVDEAGMLDQDLAHALLTIADEHQTRVALLGDRHQLPAIGRGGVLDLAARFAVPGACLTLDSIHRFTRTVAGPNGTEITMPDDDYAELSLAMRTAADATSVFDALHARGLIHVHATKAEQRGFVARTIASALNDRTEVVLLADTRDQVSELNDLVRGRLVEAGEVDDKNAVTTATGQRIAVGDRVATRRNDRDLQVANRDMWIVRHVAPDGTISITGPQGDRALPAGYVRDHLELAYASTVYGAQGETTARSHVVLGEHSSAASAYVAMTRGRQANVAHLVADTLDDAREQWAAVFARDRADLGPGHAAELARTEASRYASLRPLGEVLPELHRVWTVEADCAERLTQAQGDRAWLVEVNEIHQRQRAIVPPLRHACEQARAAYKRAGADLERVNAIVSSHAAGTAEQLRRDWDAQREPARQAARAVQAGPGRFGQHRGTVRQAAQQLQQWSAEWHQYLPTWTNDMAALTAFASQYEDPTRIYSAFDQLGRTVAEQANPNFAAAFAHLEAACQEKDESEQHFRAAIHGYDLALYRYGPLGRARDPAALLNHTQAHVESLRDNVDAAKRRVEQVLAEPTLQSLPTQRIAAERDRWLAEREGRRRSDATSRAFSGQRQFVLSQDPYAQPETGHAYGPDR